ncbi:MAG: zinc ribbon domain-containing protein [Chloroflexi bacterium]|nr:zinc ribbon domain-containing protein [Chloroflexota bacterium]
MRRVFFCAAMALWVGLWLAAAPPARAQDPNRATQLRVSVWPEYDQPSVLVMYDGTLADTANLPREISVVIPSSAALLVTTYENADGTLAAEQPSKSADAGGGYTRVSFTVKSVKYHVEYYDSILRGSPDKTMEFAFKAPAPIDQLTFDIQQPLKASNFAVTPQSQGPRNDGTFNYFTLQFPNVTAAQVLTAQVKYTKTDPNPSVLPTTAPASVPATLPQPASSSVWNNIFIIAGLVLVGLSGVLGFVIFQQRARHSAPATIGGTSRSRRKARRNPTGGVFCTQCGRELGPEDNFCPKCGAKRRAV